MRILISDTVKQRLYIGLLVTVVALTYGNTLANDFTMDDIQLFVVNNPQVTHPTLRALFSPSKFTNVFRPVTFGTFALDWKIGQGFAPGFHVVNLVLHAIVTLLLYMLLQRLFQGLRQANALALATALLFAVHPIHTEAVASISGRSELLCAGFLIAAWLLHLEDREVPALICFALALLSKESAIVLLPLIIIGDYANNKWKSPLRYLRTASITLLYLAVLWKVRGNHLGAIKISLLDNPLVGMPSGLRILNALRVAWKYVGLQLYPATLSCDYSYNQIPLYSAWRSTLPAALATVAVVGCWIWAVRKRQPGLVLAGGIYMTGFIVTANILMPIGTIMGERLAYLPSAGFCLLAALAWNWLRERQRTLALGVFGILIALLGARTIVRNRDWRDNETLYSAQLRNAPGSAKTHQNMALVYMNHKQFDLARKEFETALQIYPADAHTLATYGVLEASQGNYQEAGRKMEKAFSMVGRENLAYDEIAVNLAALYIQTNHIDGALDLLNREIAESPEYAPAWANRAVIHYKRGDTAAARADLETALRLDPGNRQVRSLMQLITRTN
jgi:tetratricopeptide (TPR) repeat protein